MPYLVEVDVNFFGSSIRKTRLSGGVSDRRDRTEPNKEAVMRYLHTENHAAE